MVQEDFRCPLKAIYISSESIYVYFLNRSFYLNVLALINDIVPNYPTDCFTAGMIVIP